MLINNSIKRVLIYFNVGGWLIMVIVLLVLLFIYAM